MASVVVLFPDSLDGQLSHRLPMAACWAISGGFSLVCWAIIAKFALGLF